MIGPILRMSHDVPLAFAFTLAALLPICSVALYIIEIS